jgi:hypothetical protein
MADHRSEERDGWFSAGSTPQMDNSSIHAKGMHVAQLIAAVVIFTLQYATGHPASESIFDAVITYIGAEISLYAYRRIWPKKDGS